MNNNVQRLILIQECRWLHDILGIDLRVQRTNYTMHAVYTGTGYQHHWLVGSEKMLKIHQYPQFQQDRTADLISAV